MGKQNGLPKGPIQLQTRKIKHDNLDERVILTAGLFYKELWTYNTAYAPLLGIPWGSAVKIVSIVSFLRTDIVLKTMLEFPYW